jgi:hypothetical protein
MRVTLTAAETLPSAPVSTRRGAGRRWSAWRVALMAGLAVLLGLVYLLGFLRPLSYRRFPDIIPTDRPLANALGTDGVDGLRFAVPVLLAFLLYAAAVLLARRFRSRRLAAAALLIGAGYAVIFVPMNPVGAQDVYHNVFDARILWRYGDNPNAVPPVAFPDDPLYPAVVAWSEFASVYGPVWYAVSGLPYAVGGDDLRANVIGHKVLTAAFLLGTAVLAYLVAQRLRPGTGVAALVAVAWNPLMLFETAGNAHNDIVMIFFAMASLYALVSRRWLWVFPLLALSVAAKYVLLLLGPLFLVWMLRQRDVPKRWVVASLGLGVIVGAAVYLPFFQGADTLEILRRQSGYNTSSLSAVLDSALYKYFAMTAEQSSRLMKWIVVPPFLLLYVWQVWRVRGDAAALIERSFIALFLLLLIATWWFWPWYVIWLVPLAAVLPWRGVALVGLLFSASALLMYVPYFWMLTGDGLPLNAATTAVAFLPPVLAGVGWLAWRRRALTPDQMALTPDPSPNAGRGGTSSTTVDPAPPFPVLGEGVGR